MLQEEQDENVIQNADEVQRQLSFWSHWKSSDSAKSQQNCIRSCIAADHREKLDRTPILQNSVVRSTVVRPQDC